MTPGTYCLHFQLSYTAGYSHFSQTYSSISYIIWMFLWTLRGPSLYSFPVWWKKAGLLTYSTISSSSLHYRHVTCSGGPQWRSLIMFYLLWARRNESKLLREHQLSCLFIYFCVFFFLCVMFFFPFFPSAAFIAALYIDKDLEYVHTFMNVCFFPRLKVSAYS